MHSRFILVHCPRASTHGAGQLNQLYNTPSSNLLYRKRLTSRGGYLVAVTGPIASGKSFLSRILKRHGVYILSADNIAKKFLKNNFHDINLAKLIVDDPVRFNQIEAAVHRFVDASRNEAILCMQRTGIRTIAFETALMFDSSFFSCSFDVCFLLCSNNLSRSKRLSLRKGCHGINKRLLEKQQRVLSIEKQRLRAAFCGVRYQDGILTISNNSNRLALLKQMSALRRGR